LLARAADAALLRPLDEIVTMVNDAPAMAAEAGPFSAPAQVVEGAPLDAIESGGFVNGEKGIVKSIIHENLLFSWMREYCAY
jgi:hypothetical protein